MPEAPSVCLIRLMAIMCRQQWDILGDCFCGVYPAVALMFCIVLGTHVATMIDRQYASTHPWITFSVDLRNAPVRVWMLLGEASSLCRRLAGVPSDRATAKDLHNIYLTKGVRATTAIEGNTLSEEQVSGLVSGTLELPLSQGYLGREVMNIVEACQDVMNEIKQGGSRRLTTLQIHDLNARTLAGLAVEAGVLPGVIRSHSVVVGRYLGAPAQDCEYLLSRLCEWLAAGDWQIDQLGDAATAILQSIIAHLHRMDPPVR